MVALPAWTFGPFRLDLDAALLWRGTEPIPLRPKDLALLHYLVQQAGRLLSKDVLLEAVWPDTFVSDDVLKGAITRLRRALGDDSRAPQWIATAARQGYRFLGTPSLVQSAPGPAAPPIPAPAPPPLLVGREAALAQLHAWWQQAQAGQRQVGFVTGAAGIGKTALLEAFLAQVSAGGPGRVGLGQCIEHYGAGEPYAPLLEVLDRLGRGPHGARLVDVLRQEAPMWLVQLPGLCEPEEALALQQRLVGTTAARMLRELAGALEVLTATDALILVLEDLHWSDAATLEALAVLAQRREPARLLILGTYRPTELHRAEQPLWPLLTRLRQQGQGAELPLAVLSEAEVAAYVQARWAPQEVPAALVHWLHARTEGHPLFLVTLVEYLEQHGGLAGDTRPADLIARPHTLAQAVPDTLRQTVESHLLRLTPPEQQVLAAASVAGVAWSAAAVAAALETRVVEVETHCEGLVQHSPFVERLTEVAWPDGTVATEYRFRHALYQQIVYERLPAAQRQRWHQRLGARLEAAYGEQVGDIAAELAMHWQQGWDMAQAVHYRQRAAEQALRRYAYREAIDHLTTALELLQTLPDTPERVRQEFDLQTILGEVLMATQGYAAPPAGQAYTRAYALGQQVDDPGRLFPVLHGLYRFHLVRGALQTAREVGEQSLVLAQRLQDPALLLDAHQLLGCPSFWLGDLATARAHLEQGMALSNTQEHRATAFLYGQDLGVVCLSYLAYTLWLLGYPAQALQRGREALTLAQERTHPFSLAAALNWAAWLHHFRREPHLTHARAEAARKLSSEQGFPFRAAEAAFWEGWALAAQGHRATGLAQMRQSLVDYQATGAALSRPYYLALLAEACGYAGQVAEGLRLLSEANTLVTQHAAHWCEAEIHRLRGELLRQQPVPNDHQAEADFWRALEVARQQQAKLFELRAAMSLARLWQAQGKRAGAYTLLAEVY